MIKATQHTHIDFHDLITVFNDIIAKHINNINEKRDEISNLYNKLDTITEKYNNDIGRVQDAETELRNTESELIELKNANKLAHERIKELEKNLSETQEQLAYSYDSGYSSEDSPEQHPPEPTPAENMAYCEDRIQEFIREDLFEAKSINHIIDIRFIPKSFTIIDKDNNIEPFYYYNDANTDPHNQGYYCSYEQGESFEHHLLTKELFADAYLRAKFNNTLKKPQKGRDIRRIPKHEDKLLLPVLDTTIEYKEKDTQPKVKITQG